MATVDQLVRDILGSVGSDVGGAVVAKWIDNRYMEMFGRVRFLPLRKVGELVLPGSVTTGTLVATRDSTTITGTSTTFQTEIGAGAQTQWYIRPSSAWYKIASVGGELAITLASNYSEDTITTAKSYVAVKRFHSLASDARILGTVVHSRLRREIQIISMTELDIMAPGRILAENLPYYLAVKGEDSSAYLEVEIYPPPEDSEILHYIYWAIPTSLSISSTIPQQVDPYTLKEGVFIDYYRYKMARALDKGNLEEAGYWRNEQRAQQTVWEKYINAAIRSMRGVDDMSLILQTTTSRRGVEGYDIKTARDHVLYNWNYP
jgi:hypothetical protein